MKLNAAQQDKIETQLGCDALPEDHSATPQLKQAFGDHTFFLDTNGLHIVEPDPSPANTAGHVVKLASWANQEHSALQGHEPEVLPMNVDLSDPTPGAA